jgi:hypothetical protein
MEQIGPKSFARTVYLQRKVAIKTEGFCLTQGREPPVLFRDAVRGYLAWGEEYRPRSHTFRDTALKHLGAVSPLGISQTAASPILGDLAWWICQKRRLCSMSWHEGSTMSFSFVLIRLASGGSNGEMPAPGKVGGDVHVAFNDGGKPQ